MPDYKIAIFFSGLERSLQNSPYNACVDGRKVASYALSPIRSMPIPACGMSRPRSITSMARSCPLNWKKRAEHFYTELTEPKLAPKSGARAIWLNMDG